MKFSRSFIPTLKQAPKDAQLNSHKYLIQGGFIAQVGSGIYNYLPMGKKVLDQITMIVKEELNNSGCQEVELGLITPASLWKESGRYSKYGKELLRLQDRKSNDFVLGPTYEEAMVDLVRNRVTSYKNLPINLYQIKTKFRDEARPRFGLLRGREFLMKDGYSFHSSIEDMRQEFAKMEQTYKNILNRLGLDYRVVEADSGSIGGSESKEFMVLASNGEDDIVYCPSCEYGANIEAAVAKVSSQSQNTKKIFKKAIFEKGSKTVCFILNISDELQDTKALNSIKNAIELVDDTENDKMIYIADDTVDINDEKITKANIRTVQAGDECLHCSAKLNITKGIEVGHIFQLGTKYSDVLGAKFLDQNGKSQSLIMGTYGMGISRLLAVMQEVNSDEKGCIWDKTIAPYQIDIIISDIKKQDQKGFAIKLYDECKANNIDVILDDRKERFGFKMGDFELIGFPYAVIVGRNIGDGTVQLVNRKTLLKQDIKIDNIMDVLKDI